MALNEQTFRERFDGVSVLYTDDFFRAFADETATSIYAFIRRLIKKGVIKRIGRGKYEVGTQKIFLPKIKDDEKMLYQLIEGEYPYSDVAVWNLSCVNEFAQHTVNLNMTILDVDRDSVESVYWFLKENDHKTVTKKRIVDGLADYDGFILIRPLVTDSPIVNTDGIITASLEKILVDMACDKEFESFQGSEIHHIYENALNEYTVNEDRMLRYAGRKEKRAVVRTLIETSKSSVK